MPMRIAMALLIGLGVVVVQSSRTVAETPAVVASIRPLHSLAAGVMAGAGSPALLLSAAASPHGRTLRPSPARMLARARVVFWGGRTLEPYLIKALAAREEEAVVKAMHRARGVLLLPARPGGLWPRQRKEGTDRGGNAPGGHKRGGREQAGMEQGGHEQGGMDPHYWLDPRNARAIAGAMVETLSAADPERADVYRRNGERVARELAALEAELARRLAPLAGRPFIVFHDATVYFERRFGLRGAGAVTVDPGRRPGVRRVKALRLAIRAMAERGETACVFTEPQFPPRLLGVLTEGVPTRTAVLDPTGLALPPGVGLYFRMMRALAAAFEQCLAPPGG